MSSTALDWLTLSVERLFADHYAFDARKRYGQEPGGFGRAIPAGRRSLRAQADQLLSLAQSGLAIRFVADPEEVIS